MDFSNSWFEGPILVQQCTFEAGTNLFGNRDRPYRVQFDVPAVLEENKGQLDVET